MLIVGHYNQSIERKPPAILNAIARKPDLHLSAYKMQMMPVSFELILYSLGRLERDQGVRLRGADSPSKPNVKTTSSVWFRQAEGSAVRVMADSLRAATG